MEYCCHEQLQPLEAKAPQEGSTPSSWCICTEGNVECPLHVLVRKSYTLKCLLEHHKSELGEFDCLCGLWEVVTVIEKESTQRDWWGWLVLVIEWVCLSFVDPAGLCFGSEEAAQEEASESEW